MTTFARDAEPEPSKDTTTRALMRHLLDHAFARRGKLVKVSGGYEWVYRDDVGEQRWRSVDGGTGSESAWIKVT